MELKRIHVDGEPTADGYEFEVWGSSNNNSLTLHVYGRRLVIPGRVVRDHVADVIRNERIVALESMSTEDILRPDASVEDRIECLRDDVAEILRDGVRQ